eukprot:TRINITY_DN16813_c0_g1_i1.p1 TRINITY_DN16813_c0_g1~~TRINITY_DN16813_c0_g1_i1.p1  ORF type:complete len:787 (-),score=139.73 TRINITY_DN16813_c0_g1_i1:17-2377(-)
MASAPAATDASPLPSSTLDDLLRQVSNEHARVLSASLAKISLLQAENAALSRRLALVAKSAARSEIFATQEVSDEGSCSPRSLTRAEEEVLDLDALASQMDTRPIPTLLMKTRTTFMSDGEQAVDCCDPVAPAEPWGATLRSASGRMLDFEVRGEWQRQSSRVDSTGKSSASSSPSNTISIRPDSGQSRGRRLHIDLSRSHGTRSTPRNSLTSMGTPRLRRSMASVQAFLSGRRVLLPTSSARITWDFVSAVLMAYDVTILPVLAAFPVEKNLFIETMEWINLCFWTFDILMSFITGYVDKGKTITSPRLIARNYLKTWFLFDVMVLAPDYFVVLLQTSDTSDSSSLGKLLRALRFARVSRLLRLAKLRRSMVIIKDRIDSEATFIVINVMRYVSVLVIFNHFIGASWYGLSVWAANPNSRSWVKVWSEATEFDGRGPSVAYAYATSLHWAWTQMTPGSMEVAPVNLIERIFSILVLITGLIIFSSFVSSITASMTQLRALKGEASTEIWQLRRFLRQYDVSSDLSFRVLRFAEYRSKRKKLVPEFNIAAIKSLSDQLRNELRYSISFSCVQAHPLFIMVRRVSHLPMSQILANALHERTLAAQDVLFFAGASATACHFLVSGEVSYVRTVQADEPGPCHSEPASPAPLTPRTPTSRFSASPLSDGASLNTWRAGSGVISLHSDRVGRNYLIEKGDWLSEPVLWTYWVHLGTAVATRECELISMGVDAFINESTQDPELVARISEYAQAFVAWLNQQNFANVTDIFNDNILRQIFKDSDSLRLFPS